MAVAFLFTPVVPTVGTEGGGQVVSLGITPWTVPVDLDILRIAWPTALAIAFVGLLESLLTAKLVGDVTETRGWAKVVDSAPGHVKQVRDIVMEPLTRAQLRQLTAIGRRIMRAIGPDDGCPSP